VVAGAKQSSGITKIVIGIAIVVAAVFTAGAAAGAAGGAAGAAGGAGAAGAGTAAGVGTGLSAAAIGSITYGNIAMVGVAIALSGVSQLLAPSASVRDYGDRERPDQRPSFFFNGPVNTAEEGQAVPIVIGKFRRGSVVISSGLTTEELAS
jgi:predicted phage tail protein